MQGVAVHSLCYVLRIILRAVRFVLRKEKACRFGFHSIVELPLPAFGYHYLPLICSGRIKVFLKLSLSLLVSLRGDYF